MNQPSKTVAPFIGATKAMLSEVLAEIKNIDHEAHRGIAHAMKNGAYLEVRVCMAFLSAEVLVNLVDAVGTRTNLGHFDFDSENLSTH